MRPSSGNKALIKNVGNNIMNNPSKIPSSIPNKTQIKKPGTSKSNSRKNNFNNIHSTNNKNMILMRDINSTPGNGLWCQQPLKEEEPYESIIPKLNKDLIELDPERESDKKIISQLKLQIKDLTTQLQSHMAKSYDAEYRAERAENNLQTYIDLLEAKSNELKDIESKNDSLESSISSLNEALNNAKKEIFRLTSELKNESDKNKSLTQNIQNLMIDKERNNVHNSSEVANLMKRIQVINEEKENLIKIIQNRSAKDNQGESKEEIQRILTEKNKILTSMETTMNKALNENAELKRRLNLEEGTKSKLNDIIKKKEEKIQSLKQQIQEYDESMNNYGTEMKWNQNQINQKDSQIKIIKDKMKKKDEEIVALNKKVEMLKKQLLKEKEKNNNQVVTVAQNKEELIPVQAKPFLFGPEQEEENDDDYYDEIIY